MTSENFRPFSLFLGRVLYDKMFTINKWYSEINCLYRYDTNKFAYLCDAAKVSNKFRDSIRFESSLSLAFS